MITEPTSATSLERTAAKFKDLDLLRGTELPSKTKVTAGMVTEISFKQSIFFLSSVSFNQFDEVQDTVLEYEVVDKVENYTSYVHSW